MHNNSKFLSPPNPAQTLDRSSQPRKKEKMNFTEIHDKVREIRELIKKVRFENAPNQLEKFIEEIGDKELDKEIIVLTARYNQEVKEGRFGIKNDYENQNKIIYAIAQILNDAKEIAIEKTTLNTGKELENLNEKGNEIIEESARNPITLRHFR